LLEEIGGLADLWGTSVPQLGLAAKLQ